MLEFTYAQVQCDAAQWKLAERLRKPFQASDATFRCGSCKCRKLAYTTSGSPRQLESHVE